MRRPIKIGAKSYEFESDDNYLARMGESFEPHMVALFRALVKPNMVVADIGANIGMTAVLFSELAKSVYAFEPGPSTFAYLKANIESSGCKNVQVVNIGLGDVPEDNRLTFAATNRSGGFVSGDLDLTAGYVTENIRIETIDSFFTGDIPRPDFIKIDVEGFEPRVIRGGIETIAAHRPTVVLELNHFCLNVMHRVTVPDFLDLLRAVFPVLIAVDKGNRDLGNMHDTNAAYRVMHDHVTAFRFPNIVCGFDMGIHRTLANLTKR